MATLETQQLDEVIANSRRRMLTLGGAAIAGLALTSMASAQTAPTLTDTDYLNFALNLEYLEGNYYSLAAFGQTLTDAGIGTSGTSAAGTVTTKPGGSAACKVTFASPLLASYAAEIALDEQKHINFLRSALSGAAVAQPSIDLYNSFNALWTAVLAYFVKFKIPATAITQTTFDPFASDINFLLGAYIFEAGVAAYSGAAPLLTVPANLNAAAGLQATEAYHYGLIRTQIYAMDQAATTLGPAGTVSLVTTGISGVRAMLDGSGSQTNLRGDDASVANQLVLLNGSTVETASGIVNASISFVTSSTDATTGTTTISAAPYSGTTNGSLGPTITPAQALAIVYAGGSGKGGFFPAGLNGNIK